MNGYKDDRVKAEKGTTFLGFIDDLRELWQAAGKQGDIVRKNFKVGAESNSVITYRVLDRIPHPSFKELKPRYRSVVEHTDIPNEYVEIYGQIFQVLVEFNVYSVNDEEADQLAEDLEDFINTYKPYFKRKGVQDIYFKKEGPNETYDKFHVPMSERSLIFEMIFEKLTPRFLNQISQIAVQANIHNDLNNKEEES